LLNQQKPLEAIDALKGVKKTNPLWVEYLVF
jgi:hypothetical protein